MKIISIFAPKGRNKEGEGLWAIEYEGKETNEFEHLLRQWDDPNYMYAFCCEHLVDLQESFGYNIDAETATDELMEEADVLLQYLVRLATQEIAGANLQYVFKPLDNRASSITELQLSKGSFRGKGRGSPKLWIYAVRIDKNTYVVTGGAIKSTNRMQDRPHTYTALHRL